MNTNFNFKLNARFALVAAITGAMTTAVSQLPEWVTADARAAFVGGVAALGASLYDGAAYWLKYKVFGAKIEEE